MNLDELERRRADVLAQLEDPNYSGNVDELFTEAQTLRGEIDSYNTRVSKARELRETLANAQPVKTQEQRQRQIEQQPTQELRTWGQRYVADTPAGSDRMKRAVEFGDYLVTEREVRALISGGDGVYTGASAGAFQRPPLQPWIATLNPDRLPRLLDLIDRGTTQNSSVDFVQDTSATGGFGGLAVEVAEGNVKPEAAASFAQKTAPVRTIAHFVPITRQALDDNPMLQSFVDGRLRYGLLRRIDNQIVNGDGTGVNLLGILNVSGIGTYAPGSAEARLISLRKARTIAELTELEPDVIVINPSDWEKVDLLTAAGSGEFMAGPGGSLVSRGLLGVPEGTAFIANQYPGVNASLTGQLWGCVVVPTTAVAAGTALLGNFREAATLWDRQQTQVLISDSHSDFFIRNQLAILAEARLALTVQQPKAFVKITFNGTT